MSIHIGTSGWRYKEWGKKFYPEKTTQEEFLPYYASKFDTVEINTSFYHLPKMETYIHWKEETPPKFLFAVKMSRYVTHILRLEGAKLAILNFMKRAAALEEKMGPILVQLPPNLKSDRKKLVKLFSDLRSAQKIVQMGNKKLAVRFALEVRNKSWYEPKEYAALIELLKENGMALVFGHSSKYPYPENEPITTDFVYLRFHGPKKFAGSLYGKKLQTWVPKIRRWSRQGIDVFAYFNNDMQAYAIKDVTLLKSLLRS